MLNEFIGNFCDFLVLDKACKLIMMLRHTQTKEKVFKLLSTLDTS